MKSLIVCLIVMILGGSSVYGQYLLGLDEVAVKEKAKELGNNPALVFSKTWYKGKGYTLNWYDNQIECQVMVSFNRFTDLSVITTFTPDDEEVFGAIVRSFEEFQTSHKDGQWILKTNNMFIKVETLVYKGKKNLIFSGITPEELLASDN